MLISLSWFSNYVDHPVRIASSTDFKALCEEAIGHLEQLKLKNLDSIGPANENGYPSDFFKYAIKTLEDGKKIFSAQGLKAPVSKIRIELQADVEETRSPANVNSEGQEGGLQLEPIE